MVLRRAEKETVVTTLADALRAAPAVAVASFRALTMTESAKLRRTLRPAGGNLRVVPKRLFRRVLEQLGWPSSLAETGDSIAVAWTRAAAKHERSQVDLTLAARSLHGFVKSAGRASLLGGALEGKPIDQRQAEQLALLPPRDVLYGQLVSVVAEPLRGLVGVFGSVLRGLPAVLHAKAQT